MYTVNDVNIFSNYIDAKAIAQMYTAMEPDWAIKGALLPDAHLGYGLPIGGVLAAQEHVVPSFVGYDIGCGVGAVKTVFSREDIQENALEVYKAIKQAIPVGFNIRKSPVLPDVYYAFKFPNVSETCKEILQSHKAAHAIGTLGGGNHFIEVGYDDTNAVWIIVHSGSRGPGHMLATHYMRIAGGGKVREGVWPLRADSTEGKEYIADLAIMLEYALWNRRVILNDVFCAINKTLETRIELLPVNLINRNHNHAELKDGLWIHRKGATHAELGMHGVIPGNMRDGSFITIGKGNADSLYSSSHGAGRKLGRKIAKETLSIEEFQNTMEGITCCANACTLDESPMAYKNVFQVIAEQLDLLDVVTHVKPIVNVKG